jgi:hypothetical protein
VTDRRWVPLGAQMDPEIPAVGSLVAVRRAVWRVCEVNEVPKVDWDERDKRSWETYEVAPCMVVIRPVGVVGEDPVLRRHDLHLHVRGYNVWHVYPDGHYPMCAACSEPMPCREQDVARDVRVASREMVRFEISGMCPACQEPVTGRQKSRTFRENVRVPLGPPVTFHDRGRCREGLWAFEDVWVSQDPDRRVSTRPAVCVGHVVVHVGTGTYECSEGRFCPGASNDHRSWRACGCAEHLGGFGRADLVGCRNLAAPEVVQ